MPQVILSVKDLSWGSEPGHPLISSVDFEVYEGDIVVLTGKSGSGKSSLLKCLAHLNLYNGDIEFYGKSPKSYGIPTYRTRVLYVPQRPSMLPGTPRDFLHTIHTFSSRQSSTSRANTQKREENIDRAVEIGEGLGIGGELWDRDWSTLSGGEAQRISLSVSLGVEGAEVLLLDEPTSALDGDTVDVVEKYLKELPHKEDSKIKAIVWVTHSEDQGGRVGSRRLRVENGSVSETSDV